MHQETNTHPHGGIFMRKTLTVLAALALVFCLSGSALAQLDFANKSFYAQGQISLPMGDLGDQAGTGIGAGVGITVPYSAAMNFRGEISYIAFGGKEFDFMGSSVDYSWSMLPILALVEYQMKPEQPFYLLGGLGLTRATIDAKASNNGVTVSADDSTTELSIALGGGYTLNEQFSLEGRYNLVSDANSFSIHGVYAF
jgi:opacity protein-like surface antigen